MPDDTATCTGCGRPIRWAITLAGKRMPLDPDPAPDGNVVPVVVAGHARARVLTGAELPALSEAWVPHHRTCPRAADFRRRKAATTPHCRVCSGPMDADLARREAWTCHPSCDPTDGATAARTATRTAS